MVDALLCGVRCYACTNVYKEQFFLLLIDKPLSNIWNCPLIKTHSHKEKCGGGIRGGGGGEEDKKMLGGGEGGGGGGGGGEGFDDGHL